MLLSDLPRNTPAVVAGVSDLIANDPISARLRDLGFVAGEAIRVTATGPIGGDPILVQIGYTRFALRRAASARVKLASDGATG
jgi:ferrous iron transport protein A